MALSAGQIVLVNDGGESPRPVIVVSAEPYNRGGYLIAIPITSQHVEARRHMPSCVFFAKGEFGLSKDCVAQADGLALIETLCLTGEAIGDLAEDATKYRDVIRAIGHVLGAECEPT
jgi:mRNA-degrading endonuclease toxin of MazEF toxin-antitoxin module